MRTQERVAAAIITFVPGLIALASGHLFIGMFWVFGLCLAGDPIEAWLDARRGTALQPLREQRRL
jgi:hypothetical protein